jgi:hypothetical protein
LLAVARAISRASKDLVLEHWEISQGGVLQRKKSDFSTANHNFE